MARNVNVLPNSPKRGLAGCHWNGTEASIGNGGRRTVRLVIPRQRYICVRECKGHERDGRVDDEGTDSRGDPRCARTIRAAEALAVGGGGRRRGVQTDSVSLVPVEEVAARCVRSLRATEVRRRDRRRGRRARG